MNFPNKWREAIDPFKLKFNNFELLEVLGYPHAGNDVFYARGLYKENEVFVFIKVNRQNGADVKNEVETLNKINLDNTPIVIDYDDEMTYRVSIALPGERLSVISKQISNHELLNYLKTYGETLAKIHLINGEFNHVKDRKFFHIPSKEYFEKQNINIEIYNYLVSSKPKEINYCFVHGDFHYANVLWQDKKISGILDFELSGCGNKEFDIAWAITVRPSQEFLKERQEFESFISGYKKVGECNVEYVKYYMVLIYAWFYELGGPKYKDFVATKMYEMINN